MHKLILIGDGFEADNYTRPDGWTLPNSNIPVLVLATVKSTTCAELTLLGITSWRGRLPRPQMLIIRGLGLTSWRSRLLRPQMFIIKGFGSKVVKNMIDSSPGSQNITQGLRSKFKTAVYSNLVIVLNVIACSIRSQSHRTTKISRCLNT